MQLVGYNRQGFFYGYIVVAVAFFILAMTWGTYATFGVFLTPISTDFGWTRAMVSGPRSLICLVIGFAGIFMGRLIDRFDPRLVLVMCGIFLGLGYSLISQVNSIWQFYLFYSILVGIGMGGSDVPLLSTVARWFVRKRGMMSGIMSAGSGVGMLVVPLMAIGLISNYGWRTAYIIIGSTALVVITSAALFLRHNQNQTGFTADGVKLNGKITASEDRGCSIQKAIHVRQFWLLSLVYFLFMLCTSSLMTHIYPHAVDLGISPPVAAGILATFGGSSIAGRFVTGSISDRVGNKLTIVINIIILAAALIWLIVAQESLMLYTIAALQGFAHGGLYVVISPITAELFGLRSHGLILGTIIFFGAVGATIGPVAVGYVFDVTGSYQLGFVILATASILAAIFAINIKTKSYQEFVGSTL